MVDCKDDLVEVVDYFDLESKWLMKYNFMQGVCFFVFLVFVI